MKINIKATKEDILKEYPPIQEMVLALVRGGYELEQVKEKVLAVDKKIKTLKERMAGDS